MRPIHCLPERSEGKTKMMKQLNLRLRYWNSTFVSSLFISMLFGCNSTYHLRYAPKGVRQQRSRATLRSTYCLPELSEGKTKVIRQQYLPFTVCAEGCETAEEQSDDEVRTSQVPEQSEGKTKVMKQQYLPFTVLKRIYCACCYCNSTNDCISTYCLRYWNYPIF